MTQFSPIAKYDIYNERMSIGMMDKLFFVDKINADLIVDFGCANGTLIQCMDDWLPDSTSYIGYDNDPEMAQKAATAWLLKANLDKMSEDRIRRTVFWSKWDAVQTHVAEQKKAGKKTAVILSSVIHEVYHYGQPQEIDQFWARIFGAKFDFIVIRDMIPSEGVDRPSDTGDVLKVLRKFRDSRELKDFERRWGSIQNNKNLLHFLLKFQYTTPNWEREVKENYFPMYWEDMMAMIPSEYSLLYHEHFTLPYIKRTVRNTFNIELKDATHLKLILERV